jgi:hypothetical protein
VQATTDDEGSENVRDTLSSLGNTEIIEILYKKTAILMRDIRLAFMGQRKVSRQ